MGTNIPIFIEYYPHEDSDCYKMYLPYTEYRAYKVVLGPVSDGLEVAKERAKKILIENISKALDNQNDALPFDCEEYVEEY
jgi:hypothetical protein